MKKMIAIAALSICATMSAMENPPTLITLIASSQEAFEQFPTNSSKRLQGPGKKVMNLRKLGESNVQAPARESKFARAPKGNKFVNIRKLGESKL
ncbi:MAG TPA: hypothetical protein VHX42_01315 [Candidatus Babeliales bacterium]|jgi:hypothetical protein|nr:hypothetical protein [Candidatus Babeliales bacterium]